MKFDGREDQLELLREIADNIADPVFLVDRAFNVWYFNRAFEGAVGVRMSSKRYKDRPCYELLGLSICKDSCVMKQAVSSKQNVRLAEIRGTVASGDNKNFHINAIPVEGASGTPFGSLIFLRDITAETEIQEKYKQLVAKNSAIALSGQIEAGNLVDIIQLFVFLQKSGQLSLKGSSGGSAQEGIMLFERGRLTGIRLGEAYNAKALDRMLAWTSGSFSFSPNVTTELERRIEGSTDFLLMDAVRERDELKAKSDQAPSAEVRPQVLRLANTETDEIEEAAWQVYEAAVEGKSVEQMLATLEVPDARIILALLTLRDKQILSF